MVNANDVIEFLTNLGYPSASSDVALIECYIDTVSSTIKNQCNISEIPTDLDNVVLMRASGNYLSVKNAAGTLATTMNLQSAYKTIKEGDTTVEFNSTDPLKTLSSYITYLTEYGKRDIAAFRKLKW